MKTQSILDIANQVQRVTGVLGSFTLKEQEGKFYGGEQEYTPRSLKAGIKAILGDISALVKSSNEFVRVSTFGERQQIQQHLVSIGNLLERKDYVETASILDSLKILIRAYNARGSKGSQNIVEERVSKLNGMCSDVEEKITKIEKISGKIQKRTESISTLQEKAQKNADVFKSFTTEIANLQQQITEQRAFNKSYKENLQSHKEAREKEQETVEELITQARQALEYKTAQGISAAFTERYNADKSSMTGFGWVMAAAVFISGVILGGIWWLTNPTDLDIFSFMSRVAVMSAALSAAWFCAGQYVKHKSIREDYGYKAVLSKSMVGFLDQLTGEERERYLAMVLAEIHKDPMRKRHELGDNPAKGIGNVLRKSQTQNLEE